MRVIINGINGRMGKEVAKLLDSGFCGAQIAAGIDIRRDESNSHPFFEKLAEYNGEADCVIDFSSHLATKELLDYCIEKKLPVVIATTGHTAEELEMIKEASQKIAVFLSANMSLGIAVLASVAKTVAKTMQGADIEIIEKHHNRKLDVPSGTALLLAEEIKDGLGGDCNVLVGRRDNGKRSKNEICIHSLRMGNVIGEHEVIVATDSQIITLKHEAQSRALFAEGAVDAAAFICKKAAGLYNMKDLVK